MKKGIIIGSLSVVIILLFLPVTSIAESSFAVERIEKQKVFLKELQENIYTKGLEPSCILRLLLWLRNIVILGGILIIARIIKRIFNLSSLPISN